MATRVPLIAGNWKMFKTVQEAVVYTKELRSLLKGGNGVDVVIAPPFTAIHAAAEAARNTTIDIAAQDLYWEREGAYTGEISAGMIKEAGATYVIVGHSERRALFGDTDANVNRKAVAALAAGLTPIVCVGETLEQREGGEAFAVLDRQLSQGLNGIPADRSGRPSSPTSRSGRSAPGATPRRRRLARCTRTCASGCGNGSGRARPTRVACCTAAA